MIERPIVSYILIDVQLKLSKKKTVDNLANMLLQPYVLSTLQLFYIIVSKCWRQGTITLS